MLAVAEMPKKKKEERDVVAHGRALREAAGRRFRLAPAPRPATIRAGRASVARGSAPRVRPALGPGHGADGSRARSGAPDETPPGRLP